MLKSRHHSDDMVMPHCAEPRSTWMPFRLKNPRMRSSLVPVPLEKWTNVAAGSSRLQDTAADQSDAASWGGLQEAVIREVLQLDVLPCEAVLGRPMPGTGRCRQSWRTCTWACSEPLGGHVLQAEAPPNYFVWKSRGQIFTIAYRPWGRGGPISTFKKPVSDFLKPMTPFHLSPPTAGVGLFGDQGKKRPKIIGYCSKKNLKKFRRLGTR